LGEYRAASARADNAYIGDVHGTVPCAKGTDIYWEVKVMAILEHTVWRILPGKWDAFMAHLEAFRPLGERPDWPQSRLYRCVAGGADSRTVFWQIEWESLAAAEAFWAKWWKEPEWQAVWAGTSAYLESIQTQYYQLIP
jgi:hypothetical protein